jgi:hypothetical protein
MGKKTSFEGVVRSYGGGKKSDVTPSVSIQSVFISLDVTAATAVAVKVGNDALVGADFVLPKGSIVIDFQTLAYDGTGGTNPTLDIGYDADTPDTDYLFVALPVNAAVATIVPVSGAVSTENGVSGTTADWPIVCLGGTGTDDTAGSLSGVLRYFAFDDGKDSV